MKNEWSSGKDTIINGWKARDPCYAKNHHWVIPSLAVTWKVARMSTEPVFLEVVAKSCDVTVSWLLLAALQGITRKR